MAGQITIRPAGPDDAGRLNEALKALSADLGDVHRATDDGILAAGFGPTPAFRALVALEDEAFVAAAVFSPLYSTTLGKAGAYVSDFWVSGRIRGTGFGCRFLSAVRDDARTIWGAGFLRLAVYNDNPRAAAFYERLGFVAREGEVGMILEGAAFDRLGGEA